MAMTGKIFAERKPVPSNDAQKDASAVPIGAFAEFGTLPRKTIMRLGLRHVSTMPVVLKNKNEVQIGVYQAEVFENKQWRTVYACESDAGEDRHKYGL